MRSLTMASSLRGEGGRGRARQKGRAIHSARRDKGNGVAEWSPDAVVPASGLPAWSEPDGSAPPATQLQGGVEVRVAERRGDWAKVECWNGWTCWLNGSLLLRRWSPTHVTPPGGLDAWPAPDPTRP